MNFRKETSIGLVLAAIGFAFVSPATFGQNFQGRDFNTLGGGSGGHGATTMGPLTGVTPYEFAEQDRLATQFVGLSKQDPVGKVEQDRVDQDRFEKLSQAMSGVKFVGNFTVTGRENKLAKEEYFILRTDKLENADYWTITARIKYGDHDLTVPMTMEIKWAGETPVITVDQMTIPGFGTFDARVIVHEGQYSGTWKHGEVGGHLFGEIIKLSDEELQDLKQKAGRRRAAEQDQKDDDKRDSASDQAGK